MARNGMAERTPWERLVRIGWDVTEAGCWVFRGSKASHGYAITTYNYKRLYAHRVSLEHKLGRPLLPHMLACHACDNRPCINPDHLFEGDVAANNRDMQQKGRARGGRSGGGCRYIEDAVVARIKPLRESGMRVVDIAPMLGVSVPFVYTVLSGTRPTPTAEFTTNTDRIVRV